MHLLKSENRNSKGHSRDSTLKLFDHANHYLKKRLWGDPPGLFLLVQGNQLPNFI